MARQVFVFDAPPGREVCDFCSASPTARLYACRNFIIPRTKSAVFQHSRLEHGLRVIAARYSLTRGTGRN